MKILASFLFLNVAAVVTLAFADDIMCRESDRAALLLFKNDLHDPAGRLSSWRGENCCLWPGVVCGNTSGQVHQLRLRNPHDYPCTTPVYDADQFEAYTSHRLGGKLNPSLLNLEELAHLDISCNGFEGAHVPDFMYLLRNLRFLDLSSSGFEGGVPSQIGNLRHLQYLKLGDPYHRFMNKLSIRDFRWLSLISSLIMLDLTGVNVSEASDWLQVLVNLPYLTELRLSRCGLKHVASILNDDVGFRHLSVLDLSWNYFDSLVPHWVFSLPNLVHLDLSHCGFHGQLPTGLLNLTQLEYLNISSNNFSLTFPRGINRLAHLKVLAVADNVIVGEIPSEIGDLTSLAILDLSGNRMGGILPKSLFNLCNLEEMYLYGNRFSGTFPRFSGCISGSLRFLYMGANNYSGSLPSNLQLLKLRELDLASNRLSGPLPWSLGLLRELEYIVISDNSFEGVVSESLLTNLTRLKIFRANGNRFIFKPSKSWIPPLQLQGLTLRSWQLGSEFPYWIKHMKHLQYLSLASTRIADTIPPWFWALASQFKYLNLSGNMIRGQIPSLLDFGLSRNVAIDMNHNLITGPLPSVSSNVTILDLSFNQFSGSMDHFLCSSNAAEQGMRLEILDLSSNSLSGEIPDCWGKWSQLSVLRLQTNNLSGKIPSSIGLLPRLQSLHLRRNSLSEEMPVSLQNCADLKVLDIGLNRLTGRIPPWIDRFSGLVFLNLRLNEFSGEIPVGICRLTSLQALDLAENNLSGRIPSCLNNLSVMAGLQPPARRMYYSAEDTFGGVRDSQFLVVKGRLGLYSSILHWVMTMDLSNNSLVGSIPVGITMLSKLQAMNLSGNSLTGTIPAKIGNMNLLESLDLSENRLSGEIPHSISELTFLSNLNLSYNNLTGRIPSSTQLEGFDESSFLGNELCGPPLSRKCNGKEKEESVGSEHEEEEGETSIVGEVLGFLMSILLGFVVGFWTVIASLVLNRSWRNAYFGLMATIGNYIYYMSVKCFLRLTTALQS